MEKQHIKKPYNTSFLSATDSTVNTRESYIYLIDVVITQNIEKYFERDNTNMVYFHVGEKYPWAIMHHYV